MRDYGSIDYDLRTYRKPSKTHLLHIDVNGRWQLQGKFCVRDVDC